MEEADNILILGIRDLGVFVIPPHSTQSLFCHCFFFSLFFFSFFHLFFSPVDEKIVSIKQLVASNPALVYQACVAYMKVIGL